MTIKHNQVQILRYSDSLKDMWDQFVPLAKNRSFLFLRDYMDYHRDRFNDHSLLFQLNGALRACLPANTANGTLYSHQGLTFGGLLMHRGIRLAEVQAIMAALRSRLATDGLETLIYRPMPHPYHEIPAEEDIVALLSIGAAVADVRATVCVRAGELERLSQNRRRDFKAGGRGEPTTPDTCANAPHISRGGMAGGPFIAGRRLRCSPPDSPTTSSST